MWDPWTAIVSSAQAIESNARSKQMHPVRTRMYGVDSLVCRANAVGYLSRLHIFLIVGLFPPGSATREHLNGFLNQAVSYSVAAKGGATRGMQTGTATVGVILTDRLAPDAQGWANRINQSQFAAIGYPVTVEVDHSRVNRPERMFVGAVYSRQLKRFVRHNVTDVLYGSHPH